MSSAPHGLSIALYQPDIPQNTGGMMRLCACFGLGLHIIEPCGFILDDRKLKKAGMDYRLSVDPQRHRSWDSFLTDKPGRLVLATTKASIPFVDFHFEPGDVILMGRESSGVPDTVVDQVDARVLIPMQPGQRSLNVAMSAGILAAEALRQTGGFIDAASDSAG